MDSKAPSILNDVLGPIMRGPSSSHTAGAFRIAKMACALLGEPPKAVRCTFDPDGSYAPTYLPLGVDLAFAAGILGWEMTDDRYGTALEALRKAATELTFDIAPLSHADHPNTVRIEMIGVRGATLTLWAKSTGGGAVTVYRVNDFAVDLDGKSWDTLVLVDDARAGALSEALGHALIGGCEHRRVSHGGETLLHWQAPLSPDPARAQALSRTEGVRRIMVSPPIFFPQVGAEPFSSAAEMVELAEKRGCGLGAVALAYECALLGLSEDEVTTELRRRYAVMRSSVTAGLIDANVDMPLTEPCASRILDAEARGAVALGGPPTRAAARAMAVMHICNSKGVVCAAPTGGSAGVLPGVLVTLEEDMNASANTVIRALLAASAVGLIVARRATFAAETAGCQVEIGVAGAMASAAVVEAAGGTPRQAANAAAIALQNTMGSVCDPVGGGCEIPCHTRNAAAAASAFVCADLIMGGYSNPVPLDETIDASLAVGMMLPPELRCTARGGIAIAPSARALTERKQR